MARSSVAAGCCAVSELSRTHRIRQRNVHDERLHKLIALRVDRRLPNGKSALAFVPLALASSPTRTSGARTHCRATLSPSRFRTNTGRRRALKCTRRVLVYRSKSARAVRSVFTLSLCLLSLTSFHFTFLLRRTFYARCCRRPSRPLSPLARASSCVACYDPIAPKCIYTTRCDAVECSVLI